MDTNPIKEDLIRTAVKHQDALVGYAYAMLRDWSSAEDVFQESIVVLSRKWERFDPEKNALSWIRGIVRFQTLNLMRTRKNEVLCGDEGLLDVIDRQFEKYADEWGTSRLDAMRAALRRCIQGIGERGRGLILGFYEASLSCRNLAQSTGRTENAVRLHLHRIRKRLKECIERKMVAEG